ASTRRLAEKVNQSSAEVPPEQSEVDLVGLTTQPSVMVQVPRLVESPWAMECRVRQILPMGTGPIAANLVIGEVVQLHVDPAILDAQNRPDPRKLESVARMGGDFWCHTTDLFTLTRPS
ncbi:MAG: flavin reductase family protein, partial [Gemmataceae bacterium]